MSSKIYTKTGDKGTTGLFGGKRVSKDFEQIEAYGNMDELNSFIGLVKDGISEHIQKEHHSLIQQIEFIQERLFSMGSHLATDIEKKDKLQSMLPELYESDIHYLEKAIDEMESHLEPMKYFILPGGHTLVSYCHIARCVCRRTERSIVKFSRIQENIHPVILPFLNRLSDYLFVLARFLSKQLNVKETPWIPKKQ